MASIYEFLKECALNRESIKEACKKRNVNPISVRRFLREARKKPYLRHRIVKKGKYVGFKYDGVTVFWDRVEEEIGERKPETEEGPELWRG